MEEKDYWLWLCSVPELQDKQISVLLRYFGSPRQIFEAPEKEFIPFKNLQLPWINKVLQVRSQAFLEVQKRKMQRCGAGFITRQEAQYPSMLREIADPPYGLFYRGGLPDPEIYTVAIVGARACSAYGASMARQIAAAVSDGGFQVVSGMAMGIDGIAQKETLEREAPGFAVLGCGVDQCYPRENISLFTDLGRGCAGGGILSEFPCGSLPKAFHFPMRNRIISGLADAVVVVEARVRSGSLITADLALDQGREVYAVPGRSSDVLSGGCNRLLSDGGAAIVTSAEDLAERLKENAAQKERKLRQTDLSRVSDKDVAAGLSVSEKILLDLLDYTPVSIDKLSQKSGFRIEKLAGMLLSLQLKGVIREIGKNQYVRT